MSRTTKTKMPIKSTTTSSFPSVKDLFIDSWYLMTSRLNRFFLFSLVNIGMLIVFYVIVFVLAATILRPILVPLFQTHPTTTIIQVLPILLVALSSLIILALLGLIAIGTANLTWMLLSIKEDEGVSFKLIFKQGIHYLIPAIITTLLLSGLNMLGFFVFVLPTISSSIFFFLSIFLVFALSEVVFLEKKGFAAIQRSYIVGITNFRHVFTRLALLFLAYLIFLTAIDSLQTIQPTLSNWISAFFEMLFSWYSVCYVYLVYQQAEAKTPDEQPIPRIKIWIWGTAIFGWIITIILIVALGFGISYSVRTGTLQKAFDQVIKQSQQVQQKTTGKTNQKTIPTKTVKITPTPSKTVSK